MRKHLLIVVLFGLFTHLVCVDLEDSTQFNRIFDAADSTATEKSQDIPEVHGMNAMQYIGALFIIALLIYIFYKVSKKLSLTGKSLSNLDKNAIVIDIIHIGNKQYIYLIYLLDEISVLGVSAGNIQLLYQIKDAAKVNEILEKKKEASENSFSLKLSEKLLKRKINEKS